MSCKAVAPFEACFLELLQVELRRQGIPQSSTIMETLTPRLLCSSSENDDESEDGSSVSSVVRMTFDGLMLGDREAMAIVETLVKLTAPGMMRAHRMMRWVLSLRDNTLTDRCVPHFTLLLRDCSPPLVSLDVRGNDITSAAAHRLAEVESNGVLMLLPGVSGGADPVAPPSLTENASMTWTSLSRMTSVGTRRGIDMEALKQRRSQLFKSTGRGYEEEERVEKSTRTQKGWLEQPNAYRRAESVTVPAETARAPAVTETVAVQPKTIIESIPCHALHSVHEGVSDERATAARPSPMTEIRGECSERGRSAVSASVPISASVSHLIKDEDEALDVTANLNPLLLNVLDLSETVPSGQLRREYGTECIWDVLNAPGRMSSITVLTLNRNDLTAIPCQLPPSLLRLDLSENALTEFSGMDQCRMLTLVSARHNRLRTMRGLEHNPAIAHLFLGHNEIAIVDGVAHLLVLETLDLSHNRLRTQASIRPLSLSQSLRTLMIRGNPVMERMRDSYRPLLRNLCPALQCIDGERLTYSRLAASAVLERNRRRLPYNNATPRDGCIETGSINVSQSANYMHLLTRGVAPAPSGGVGYGGATKAANTAQAMQKRAAAVSKKHHSASRASGEPLRQELMRRLALESKRFLESVVVERLTSMQVVPSSESGGTVETEPEELNESPNVRPVGMHTQARTSVDTQPRTSTDHPDYTHTVHMSRVQHGVTVEGAVESLTPAKNAMRGSPPAMSYAAIHATSSPANTIPTTVGIGAALGAITNVNTIPAKSTVTTRRDATLDDEEWLKLRQQRGRSRSVPFGETPPRPHLDRDPIESGSKGGIKPRGTERQAPRLSPIRRSEDESRVESTNSITDILPDMSTFERHSQSPIPPRLVSPPAGRSPIKAVRLSSSSNSPTNSYRTETHPTAGNERSASKELSEAPSHRKVPMFSPPPPFSYPPEVAGAAERERRALKWTSQLRQDAEAVQVALRTVVGLVDAQRSRYVGAKSGECSFAEERMACAAILTESGMLHDTEVPSEVVEYYRLTQEELEQTSILDDDSSEMSNPVEAGQWGGGLVCGTSARQRLEVLRAIRLLGDGKTCLRYMVLLMEEEREDELRQYVDEIKSLLI